MSLRMLTKLIKDLFPCSNLNPSMITSNQSRSAPRVPQDQDQQPTLPTERKKECVKRRRNHLSCAGITVLYQFGALDVYFHAECRRLKVMSILIWSARTEIQVHELPFHSYGIFTFYFSCYSFQIVAICRCDRVFPCESCRKRGCACTWIQSSTTVPVNLFPSSYLS